MIYHYYVDPALMRGTDESDASLINVLNFARSLSHNVLLEAFEDDRLRSEFGESIRSIPNPEIKQKVMQIFKRLAKRNRFILTVEPDYSGAKSDIQCAIEQCAELSIDAVVTEQPTDQFGIQIPQDTVFNFTDYLVSHVEENRSRLVSEGRMCAEGSQSVDNFLKDNFWRLLRYASEIDICDKLLGEKYGTKNWKNSIQRLLKYIEEVNESPSKCAVTFHTSCPGGKGEHELKRWICEGLNQLHPKLKLYGKAGARVGFHHDRFIVTEKFAIMVTSGFDVLNTHEDKNCNRDTNLDFKNPKDIWDSLEKAEAEHPSKEI